MNSVKTLIASVCAGAALTASAGAALAGEDKHKGGMMENRFSMMDSDNDGMITQTEYQNKAMDHFSKMDANGNGVITMEEMEQAKDKMKEQMKEKRGGM